MLQSHFRVLCVFISCAWMMLLPASLHAGGGVYIDNLVITNDGRIVFSDDFNAQNLNKWIEKNDATIECTSQAPKQWSLYLNRHNRINAYVRNTKIPAIEKPGIVEVKASLWLTPPSDQWGWFGPRKAQTWALFCISSGSRNCNIGAGPFLNPGDRAYRIELRLSDKSVQRPLATTKPCAVPGAWIPFALHVDFREGSALATLGGRQVGPIRFEPSYFRSVKGASILTWFGDGAQIK